MRAGGTAREAFTQQLPGQAPHYRFLGLDLGFCYTDGALIPEAAASPEAEDPVMTYRPTIWPGARLPHFWVAKDNTRLSIHDTLGSDAFTLLVREAGAGAWRRALSSIEGPLAMPVRCLSIGAGSGADLRIPRASGRFSRQPNRPGLSWSGRTATSHGVRSLCPMRLLRICEQRLKRMLCLEELIITYFLGQSPAHCTRVRARCGALGVAAVGQAPRAAAGRRCEALTSGLPGYTGSTVVPWRSLKNASAPCLDSRHGVRGQAGVTAEGIALIISTGTNLLALGVPALKARWESRRSRRQVRKDEIERLLFFVLCNYHEQAAGIYDRNTRRVEAAWQCETLPFADEGRRNVDGFQPSLVRLKALAAMHAIHDAGFCAAIDTYLTLLPPPPQRADGEVQKGADWGAHDRAEQAEGTECRDPSETVQFLSAIETKFGWQVACGRKPSGSRACLLRMRECYDLPFLTGRRSGACSRRAAA